MENSVKTTCVWQSSSKLMRRECVYLCDASSLINTKGFINTKENELWIQQHANRDVGGTKLTYFTTTKTRTTTANSIKFPMQLAIKMARRETSVSLLGFWVNNETENHNFTSIKVIWSSELKSSKKKKKRKSTAFFDPNMQDVRYLLFI